MYFTLISLSIIKFSRVWSLTPPIKKLFISIVNAALSISKELRYFVSHPPSIDWKLSKIVRTKYLVRYEKYVYIQWTMANEPILFSSILVQCSSTERYIDLLRFRNKVQIWFKLNAIPTTLDLLVSVPVCLVLRLVFLNRNKSVTSIRKRLMKQIAVAVFITLNQSIIQSHNWI